MDCPRCGSERAESAGPNIYCRDCKRYSRKIRRSNPIPADKRPPCPDCGNSNPYSGGKGKKGEQRWVCRNCGRQYMNEVEKYFGDFLREVEVE